jgi:hypothetical protein
MAAAKKVRDEKLYVESLDPISKFFYVNMYLKCCKSNKKKRSPQMIFKSKEQ